VINLVAQGSIEQGMLGVLAFKKSLFAGVLDGGDRNVFMNGTRLSKFMESVDEVTGSMGPADVAEVASARAMAGHALAEGPQTQLAQASSPQMGLRPDAGGGEAPASDDDAAASHDAPTAFPAAGWAPLLEAGLQWLAAFSDAPPPAGATGARGPATARITTDPATGERNLTVPLPDPATLRWLADGLKGLLTRLQRPG
jgi:hypothetical protein